MVRDLVHRRLGTPVYERVGVGDLDKEKVKDGLRDRVPVPV